MPHTSEEYKRAAADTRKLAAWITNTRQRHQLMHIAAEWERLAEYLARNEPNEAEQDSN